MDAVSWSSVVTGLASGVVSAVLTYFGTRSKIRLEMTVEYDKALHNKRLEVYKELWPLMADFGGYKPDYKLTCQAAKNVLNDMHKWYFHEGGIYLSRSSRKPYFDLKELALKAVREKSDEVLIGGTQLEVILDAASRLRTSLAEDVGARRAPWL